MAQVALNADLYAAARLNIFFKTVYPSLEGQCVTLVKGFMQDMSSVPNPHAARGDARYVGNKLVAEGLAVEVPAEQRKRGDIVCYEFGIYGHIGVQLSGGRIFEENVKWPGVAAKIVAGGWVYASRIGSEKEAWRADKNAHYYRLKSYKEGSNTMTTGEQHDVGTAAWRGYLHREPPTYDDAVRVGKQYQDAKGNLTPASIIHGLNYLKNSLEWQQQDAKIKAPSDYINAGTVDGKPVYRSK